MRFLTIGVTLYTLFLNFDKGDSVDWLECLKYHITKDINPYQVTFFIDNVNTTVPTIRKRIITMIAKEIPIFKFDIDSVTSIYNEHGKNSLLLRNLRYATLNVVLYERTETFVENNFHRLIDLFAKTQRSDGQRKKFLILYFRDGDLMCENFIEDILLYSWNKKFLDFTILEIKRDSDLTYLHNYNPFYNRFTKIEFSDNVEIFPNKLRNVNEYPFTLVVFENQHVSVEEVNGRIKVRISSDDFYAVLRVALSLLNFTIEYHESLNKHYLLENYIKKVRKFFDCEQINGTLLPLPFNLRIPNTSSLYMEYELLTYVGIVPIFPAKILRMPYEILVYLVAVNIIVMCFINALDFFKLLGERWLTIDVVQLFFGAMTPINPRKFIDRVILISMLFYSMIFSTLFYSNLVDVKIVYVERPMRTFKELDETHFRPYVNEKLYDIILHNEDNPYIKSIKERTVKLNEIQECIDILKAEKNSLCLLMKWNAQAAVKKASNPDGGPTIRIAEPIFAKQLAIYTLEEGSPYTDKLQEIFRRIYETGLWNKWYRLRKVRLSKYKNNFTKEITKNILFIELVLVLSVGYFLGLTAFIWELFARYDRSKTNR